MLTGVVRIRSLRMENFRGFEDETIDLDRPLTVLVGVNGAGKSSVLDAVAIACEVPTFIQVRPPETEGRAVALNRDVREGAQALRIVATFGGDAPNEIVEIVKTRGEMQKRSPLPSLLGIEAEPPVFYYRYERSVAEPFESDVPRGRRGSRANSLDAASEQFGAFFRWFKAQEDVENQEKVKRQDFSHEDPHLRAVRSAVERMLPGFAKLRIERSPLHMVVSKGHTELLLDQLSAGERGLLALVADLTRRLAVAFPTAADPLAQEALVLIDEIELHLHPAWQRRVLPSLRRTFPNCQFVVTTHSPQVISEVPNDAVVLLQDFKFSPPPTPTSGRDSNAILEQVMGVPERPEDVARAFDEVRDLIDDERFEEARARLEALRERVTEHDGEWLQLSTRVHVLEHFDAPDHQGA
jgi:predicted ATP-binding protein involved in virulence